jgi:hypothetical protein
VDGVLGVEAFLSSEEPFEVVGVAGAQQAAVGLDGEAAGAVVVVVGAFPGAGAGRDVLAGDVVVAGAGGH